MKSNIVELRKLCDNKEKLTFGKYQGRTLASVLSKDSTYLMWVIAEEKTRYRISDEWRNYLDEYSYNVSKKRYATYMR